MLCQLLIRVIQLYQFVISPWLPPMCRYTPTCSEYAIQALRTHGLWRGLRLAIGRLLRCHPFHPGGYDPVPMPEQMKY
ncbi:MAG TPA: membrane protein insertion efficiency factor YidD [Armatimonadetes bacterium]|nr:membrane protein insertion efficiency factor YidD [Armatimonadota bacterium]